jgi:hypothetical protein
MALGYLRRCCACVVLHIVAIVRAAHTDDMAQHMPDMLKPSQRGLNPHSRLQIISCIERAGDRPA